MHELIKKPAVFAIFFLMVAFVAFEGVAYAIHERGQANYSGLSLVSVNCKDFSNSPSSNYNVTIIDQHDAVATQSAVMALIQKYGGEVMSNSSYSENDQFNPKSSATTEIDTMDTQANLSLNRADAFIQELQALVAGANAKIESPSYSQTTGAQTVQNCIDNQNYIATSLASVKLYMQEMPVAIANYEFSSSSQTSNISELNSEIQSAYNQVVSENDNISLLAQNANKISVTIGVQNHESPVYSNSDYYPQPDSNNDN